MTTVTAINGSGLRAGTLPITPIYSNWQDAYKQLGKAVRYFYEKNVQYFILFNF